MFRGGPRNGKRRRVHSEIHIPRTAIAPNRHAAMQVGRLLRDPRSTVFGLWLLSIIALWSDSYAEVLEYSEQSLAVAVTPVQM